MKTTLELDESFPSNYGGTSVDLALLCVRFVAGVTFVAHGAQKLFGSFGGEGLASVVDRMGLIGYPVVFGEFFGGLGLLLGFLSRFSAASLIVIMIGAIIRVHGKFGFFLGDKPGYEFNFALIGLLLPTLIAGPGRIAIARMLFTSKADSVSRPPTWIE